MSETLKPCPFCSTVPEQPLCFKSEETGGKWGYVECTYCGARAGDIRTGYALVEEWAPDAAKEWNTRAPDPETERLRSLLRRWVHGMDLLTGSQMVALIEESEAALGEARDA